MDFEPRNSGNTSAKTSIDQMSLVLTNEIKAVYGEKVRFRLVVSLDRLKIKLLCNLYRLKFFFAYTEEFAARHIAVRLDGILVSSKDDPAIIQPLK